MTWRRKENNNYNNKSLILLGKVSNIQHMKSFGSIKDQISRDIIIQHEIPLTTFSIVLLGLSVPFSFVTGLNTIQCTLPTSASNGLLCKCSNYLNIFSVIFSSNHATPISPHAVIHNHFISCPFFCGHASILKFSLTLLPPFSHVVPLKPNIHYHRVYSEV